MDDSGEVEAYASATAQEFLGKIHDTFVEHAVRLLHGRTSGRALDIGTGPGEIVLKLARRLAGWNFIGVDRSSKMIAQARTNLAAAGGDLRQRVEFQIADGNRLAFSDASFDFLMCNSVLHHLAEPQHALGEIARLTSPDGAILLRDLRRPSRLAYAWHVRWNGRKYSGTMYKLFCDSVRASYTVPELQRLLDFSPIRGAQVFTHRRTHVGIERSAGSPF